MSTNKTKNISTVFCIPLEDPCMEGQAADAVGEVSEVNAVSTVNKEG